LIITPIRERSADIPIISPIRERSPDMPIMAPIRVRSLAHADYLAFQGEIY
jgi:hypothetical protein